MNDQYAHFQKRAEKKLSKNRTELLINAFFETLDEPETQMSLEDVLNGTDLATSDYFSYLSSFDASLELDNSTNILGKDFLEDEPKEEDLLEIEDDIVARPTLIADISDELELEENGPQLKHQDIIDRFIANSANDDTFRIDLSTEEETRTEEELDNPEPTPSEDELETDYFFSQTLANIYIKQKKYNRAHEIIRHLSLNYPEKNIYFADQLSFLEKLIKNTNINK
jgi:hypothetical protein